MFKALKSLFTTNVIPSLGMGNFILPDKTPFDFTEYINLSINLVEAINTSVLENIILGPSSDRTAIEQLLKTNGIEKNIIQ